MRRPTITLKNGLERLGLGVVMLGVFLLNARIDASLPLKNAIMQAVGTMGLFMLAFGCVQTLAVLIGSCIKR